MSIKKSGIPIAPSNKAGGTLPLKVFVHLAADKDSTTWYHAWHSKKLVGINDETPYGYGRARHMGCDVVFSRTIPENFALKVLRLGLRVLTGFDVIHAWRQRHLMLASDVIWTHTESQYLAAAFVLAISKRRPKLLGQSVWLFDRWHKLTPFHRVLYRFLLRYVDILTFHSTLNLAFAKVLFPGKRVILVPFGIPSEIMSPPTIREGGNFRILSIGNDRHRDWVTFASALDGLRNIEATILSGTAPKSLTKGRPYLRITQASTNDELFAHFADANVVCVPLKDNMHASGITVIQEAVLAGVPVVASSTGGLESYFSCSEVRYVPVADHQALGAALKEVMENPEKAKGRAVSAQRHMLMTGMGAESFIRQHVELSRDICGK